MQDKFSYFQQLMESERMPALSIEIFKSHYEKLTSGRNALIPDSEIKPIITLPDLKTVKEKFNSKADKYSSKTVVIKLNGGLGTSMGMECAKSLIEARDGVSFLEIIASQTMKNRQSLCLMDSFSTYADSKNLLDSIMPEQKGIPRHFIQSKVPKVRRADLMPAKYPENPALEWCPPGHGDIYASFITAGILDSMISSGAEYAFISNADNLGAVMEPAIPAYMEQEGIPFIMEVSERAREDRKGGHIAADRKGGILLRELAQCPDEDLESFQNIGRYCFFNTNSIWIKLSELKKEICRNGGRMALPLIINKKTVDPRNPDSDKVYQLETAMGCAISSFPGAKAILVSRDRFRPVKTTNDLLLLRSDIYRLTSDRRLEKNAGREKLPFIDLDPDFYKMSDSLAERFPSGAPSLKDCISLKIKGDVVFSKGISVKGDASVINLTGRQAVIPAGTLITGEYIIK
ncbi:MAG: UTP--glucose-1-phosphate uridylyltransferase [bacterium]|nr:UTP--glucose-1-phosphate uridylyltransferase [bacterium]